MRGRLQSGRREGIHDQATPKTLLTAIAVHVVVIMALVRLVTLGHGLHDWFGLSTIFEKPVERVTYVETPKPKPPEPKKVAAKKPVAKKATAKKVVPLKPAKRVVKKAGTSTKRAAPKSSR